MAAVHELAPTQDRSGVLELFQAHRAIHIYGLADVAQFWETSRWWVRDGGVVGLVGLPGVERAVVYAISAVHGGATLRLLQDLAPQLPERFDITGPSGLTERLDASHRATRSAPYVKMQLLRADMLPASPEGARVLEPGDLPAVRQLADGAGEALTFFREDLLGSGRQVGVFVGGRLAALAGVHVIDVELGVAAIGDVLTAPELRGRGFAAGAVAALCRRLGDEVATIGLNVGRDNTPARTLYERLGFLPLMEYEEAELVRR